MWGFSGNAVCLKPPMLLIMKSTWNCNLHLWPAAQTEVVLNGCCLWNSFCYLMDIGGHESQTCWGFGFSHALSSVDSVFWDNFCLCSLMDFKRKWRTSWLLIRLVVFCPAALTPSAPLALMPPPSLGASQPVSVSRVQMQLHLQGLQQNTNALRKQLSQLRNMQVGVSSSIRMHLAAFSPQCHSKCSMESNYVAWSQYFSVLFTFYFATLNSVSLLKFISVNNVL